MSAKYCLGFKKRAASGTKTRPRLRPVVFRAHQLRSTSSCGPAWHRREAHHAAKLANARSRPMRNRFRLTVAGDKLSVQHQCMMAVMSERFPSSPLRFSSVLWDFFCVCAHGAHRKLAKLDAQGLVLNDGLLASDSTHPATKLETYLLYTSPSPRDA